MYKIVSVLVVSMFFLAGCSNVEVYTFKKDRVDQGLRGNRGYLQGTAPSSDVSGRSSKRTLIGVDIDMGGDKYDAGEDVYTETSSDRVLYTESSGGTVTTVVQEQEYIK